MTDEERRNRNPKPEIGRFKLADCPEVPLDELVRNRVYILSSARGHYSLNFHGKELAMHPHSLEPVMAYKFYGPRINLWVNLTARDGHLVDTAGTKVTVRQYNGPDQ